MNEHILSGLTEKQKTAASHMEGPMLVLAGPGSGKTRVITHRIAHLAANGVYPNQILGLTFTNKAAEEMRTRLENMKIPRGATLCTFHSLCARLLRENSAKAGIPEGFSIYDTGDQKTAIGEILKAKNLDPQEYQPGRLLKQISLLKNLMIGPDAKDAQAALGTSTELIAEIYEAYEKRLKASGALDFDDLLLKTAKLLKTDEEIRERLGRRYRYILVDEYQDTNPCQYKIAAALARDHRNLFVTGDPDQSIYGWRGADIGIILAFEKDYPDARVVRLEENFRSTPEVLKLADDLIQANTRRKEKRLIAKKPAGSLPRLFRFTDEHEEARGAAAWARTMHDEHGIDFGSIAIFYRMNAMSRLIEEELIKAAIPYQIVKGLEFFDRREIKDMLAYLRLMINPADDVSFLRIVNRPARGLGDVTIKKLLAAARAAGTPLSVIARRPEDVTDLPAAAASKLRAFAHLVEDFKLLIGRPVAEIVKTVFELSKLRVTLEEEENTDAIENVQELINSATEFDKGPGAGEGLSGYLQQTSLISDADGYREGSGAVSLMTLHTAKGLEFAAVLIIGVENGLIPHTRSFDGDRDNEEERRLLFVGITRAEKYLAMSHAMTRMMYGVSKPATQSSFLNGLQGLEIVYAPFLNRGFSMRAGRIVAPSMGSSMAADSPEAKVKGSERTPSWAQNIIRPGSTGGEAGSSLPNGAQGNSAADGSQAPAPRKIPLWESRIRGNVTSSAASGDSGGFRTGQRVRHPALGDGMIENIMADGTKFRAIVQFTAGARLTLDLGLAKLEPLE